MLATNEMPARSFWTAGTGSFLAFCYPHKIFDWLNIELLSALVTDDHLLLATSPAHAFLRLAGNEVLYPRQISR
jgi:hypothetical protein